MTCRCVSPALTWRNSARKKQWRSCVRSLKCLNPDKENNAEPAWRWSLLPLAVLAFWSPIGMQGSRVVFDFNPLLLFTSPDYGLAYCFMTPVFLFLLILGHPRVDSFAFYVTAFNALLYGLFNLVHWFDPDRVVMGVMHLPLLLLALMSLVMLRYDFSKHHQK